MRKISFATFGKGARKKWQVNTWLNELFRFVCIKNNAASEKYCGNFFFRWNYKNSRKEDQTNVLHPKSLFNGEIKIRTLQSFVLLIIPRHKIIRKRVYAAVTAAHTALLLISTNVKMRE